MGTLKVLEGGAMFEGGSQKPIVSPCGVFTCVCLLCHLETKQAQQQHPERFYWMASPEMFSFEWVMTRRWEVTSM